MLDHFRRREHRNSQRQRDPEAAPEIIRHAGVTGVALMARWHRHGRWMQAVISMMRVIVFHHCSTLLRRHKKYRTGMTTSVSTVDVIIPPTIGAAIRFITSAPVP